MSIFSQEGARVASQFPQEWPLFVVAASKETHLVVLPASVSHAARGELANQGFGFFPTSSSSQFFI